MGSPALMPSFHLEDGFSLVQTVLQFLGGVVQAFPQFLAAVNDKFPDFFNLLREVVDLYLRGRDGLVLRD